MSSFSWLSAQFETGVLLEALDPFDLANEKHYSVIDIAKLWALREKTARRIFEREPGVIRWSREEKMHKRGYARCARQKRFFIAYIVGSARQADGFDGCRKSRELYETRNLPVNYSIYTDKIGAEGGI